MSVGTANFYKMRGSLSSNEYPLLSANQNLSSFLISSAAVKYAKGLQTRIRVPSFTGFETVNVVEIDGQYYWATEWAESTTVNETIEYTLDYMAPTSFVRSGDTLKGVFDRTPTIKSPYLRIDNMTDGIYKETRVLRFDQLELGVWYDHITDPRYDQYAYWCQVTGTTPQNGIKMYGFFISYANEDEDLMGGTAVPCDSSGDSYPTFRNIIGGEIGTYFPDLTAESITDISISKRCPFPFKRGVAQTSSSATAYYYKLADKDGNEVNPNKGVFPGPVTYNVYVYDLTALAVNVDMRDNTQSIIIYQTEQEHNVGHIAIKDWNRNELLEIPTQLGATIGVTARCHSDISGVSTIIRVGNTQITVPEGKLPFFGSTSDTYRAYQMNSDRLALQQATQRADYDFETGMVANIGDSVSTMLMGATMGGLSGNPATFVTGIMSGVTGGITNAYKTDRADTLARDTAKMDFELSKKRALEQPSSGYNTGYGTIYAYLNEMNPLKIAISKPSSVTNAYYDAWINEFGYPAEGVITLAMTTGRMRGRLISDSIDKSGMYWDELNRTFERGFKFVDPA